MQLKVQIISYDVLIAGLFFLLRFKKNFSVQDFTYAQKNHTLCLPIEYQIFVQKRSAGKEKDLTYNVVFKVGDAKILL